MMEMYFHFRIEEPILFREWKPQNVTAYVFTCIGIYLIAFALEVLKFGRMKLVVKQEANLETKPVDCCCSTEEEGIWNIPETRPLKPEHISLAPFTRESILAKSHIASSILSFVQNFVEYSLMLVAMTYNWPIFWSLLAGHATAYFFLGPFMTVEESEVVGTCCS
uniref:Copper transport protein n=1 Tax=Caenorhabditis japonica TaxID=281687 RepID=A0A8R1HUX8_CAEJA